MKVLTWNINGIRAVTGKTGVQKMLESLDADVVCLQETKVTRDMLDEPTAIVDGYESYFSFSRKRTGYSGTANYCSKKSTPVRAEEGLTGRLQVDEDTSVGCYGNTDAYSEEILDSLDAEGRCVITQHRLRLKDGTEKEVAIINVYVPRAGDRPERLDYKLKFLTLLQSRAQALLRENVHVIILGDLNLTHTAKDNCDPKSDADFLRRSSRVWINNILRPYERDPNIAKSHPDLEAVALSGDAQEAEHGDDTDEESLEETQFSPGKGKNNSKARLVKSDTKCKKIREDLLFSDVYRFLHPNEVTGYTNWDTSTDARKSNYGRRLDYILVDTVLAGNVTDCRILREVEGSDHCPVVVSLDCQPLPCNMPSPPQLCSKLMPEFRGQQQKLSSFFTKSVVTKKIDSDSPSSSQGSLCSSQEDKDGLSVDVTGQLKKSVSAPYTSSSSPEKVSLKRGKSSVNVGVNRCAPPTKKTKQTGAKQASLISFFAPKRSTSVNGDSHSGAKPNSHTQDKLSVVSSETNQDVICVETQDLLNNTQQESSLPLQTDNTNQTISFSEENSNKSNADNSQPTTSSHQSKQSLTTLQSWKSLLCGPAPPPLCPGHKEPCVLKTVRKNGPNKNKQFYSCSRPDGPPGNPQFRCNFFQWLHDRQKKKT